MCDWQPLASCAPALTQPTAHAARQAWPQTRWVHANAVQGNDSNNKAPCARDPSDRHGELLHPQDVRRHCEKMHMHSPVPH